MTAAISNFKQSWCWWLNCPCRLMYWWLNCPCWLNRSNESTCHTRWYLCLGFFLPVTGPRGLTLRWLGCCGLRFWRKPTELAHSFSFCSCVYFCLYGPFDCISFRKFSRQLSTFSFCSSGLISALLVLSTIYLYESLLQPWYNPLWFGGLKAPTNWLTNLWLMVVKLSVPFSLYYYIN